MYKVRHSGIEDEEHFLFSCTPLAEIKRKYLNTLPLDLNKGKHKYNLILILNPTAEFCYTFGKLVSEFSDKAQ